MSDSLRFLRQWAAAPLQVAAIAPSGKSLARLMVAAMGGDSGPVIELGPGTGVFTRAMIDSGVPETDIAMIELNPEFVADLSRRFPKAQVHNMSAGDLAQTSFFDRPISTVISGLGLLSMPQELVEDILTGVFHHLEPGGAFVQFTYGPKCPVPAPIMSKLELTARKTGGTWWNLPPASVYRVTKG